MKNGVFWDVTRVALVRTNISEELGASIIRVTKIGERERLKFLVHRILTP
jgi:hypothetical protein